MALGGACVLVTGGSTGIGFAVARECARAGARVGICARTMSNVESAVKELRDEAFVDIMGDQCDVTEEGQLEQLLDTLEAAFGPLKGVVHCAAVLGPIGSILESHPAEWRQAVEVNLFGTYQVLRQCGKRLASNGGGRMVLFSGGGATAPFPNYSAYACGKVGLVRLAETAAAEMAAYSIEVNCVAPGFVITRLHEETLLAGSRAGEEYLARTMAEIETGGVPATVGARAAVFLLSDAAKGITGKLVAAVHDELETWPLHLPELSGTDLFTLRRIVPRDRGLDWQ